MSKVWFITGSSRGLGRSLTEAVLEYGDIVVATARKPEQLNELNEKYPDQILALKLDVTDKTQILAAIKQAINTFSRIDVLVNNAGFGITGATEAFTDEQVRSQLETNLYAPIEITRNVLPIMRKQRSGRILQISSIGGRIGFAGLSIYHATKFGLSGFTESLINEVAPLDIKVTSVEPGGFRTDWGGSSMSYAPQIEGYETTVDSRRALFESGDFNPMGDPDKAANVLIDLVDHPEPPAHLVLGSEAVAFLKQADERRKTEFEKWIPVSISTDHDEAIDFHKSDEGQKFLNGEV